MALQDEPKTPLIMRSLQWLEGAKRQSCDAVSSLAWTIFSLFLFGLPVDDLKWQAGDPVGEPSRYSKQCHPGSCGIGTTAAEKRFIHLR